MNNKKGFTLVELLAVIIIIGVIASITIVSVNKTINNSKSSLSKVQIKNIEEAAEAYYIKEGMSEGNSCVNVSYLISDGYIEAQEVIDPKNKETMKGSVKITYKANKYSYDYNEDECQSLGNPVNSTNKTLAGNIPSGNYEPGDEYIINVDGIHEYHFYVLSTEGDKVSLILSGNICSDGTLATSTNKCLIPWMSKDDYKDDTNYGSNGNSSKGPITAMNYLYEATRDWSNIENIQMNYTDEGSWYGKIITSGSTTKITMKDGQETLTYNDLKTRMPMKSEIEGAGCLDVESCPAWMVNGLNVYTAAYPTGTKEDISGIQGYWSISSYNASSSATRYVYFYGSSATTFVNDKNVGVRPVIEVSKAQLSKNKN